jgi:hypothetical protein
MFGLTLKKMSDVEIFMLLLFKSELLLFFSPSDLFVKSSWAAVSNPISDSIPISLFAPSIP